MNSSKYRKNDKISSDDEYPEAVEIIPSDMEMDEKELKESRNKTYNENENYKDLLELKIRKQAKRLYELQEYKQICEKRISQLSPNHPFPILESHIKNHEDITKSYSSDIQSNNHAQSMRYQIQELNKLLSQKENENLNLNKKYESLQIRYNNTLRDTVPKSIFKKDSSIESSNFPSSERIPNEKLREAYSKLAFTHKDLINEKDSLMKTLRDETIANEEQRNYIEILKQTIESSLLKNGLYNHIQTQKNLHYSQGHSTVDVFLDISQLKSEMDKNRKDLIKSQIFINELQEEVDFLRNTNNEMNSKKEKIKESLENGIKELEEAKEKVRALEDEKDYLNDQLNELREENEKIIKDYENLIDRNSEYEKELDNNEKIINELKLKVEHTEALEEKLLKYKEDFSNINSELNNIVDENRNLKDNNKSLIEDVEYLKNELSNMKSKLKEYEEKNLKLSELSIKHKSLNEKLKESETNGNNLQNIYTTLKSEYDELIIKYNICSDNLSFQKKTNENLIKEKDNLIEDNTKLKNENLKIILECDKLKFEANDYSGNYNKLLTQYENLNKTYKNLESMFNKIRTEKETLLYEINNQRENYEKELINKTGEIKRYQTQLNIISKEKNDLDDIKNEYVDKLKQVNQKDYELSSIKKEYNHLINNKNYLESTLEEKDKIIKHLEVNFKENEIRGKNNFHEAKLAIHSCLSVANIFLKKFNDFIVSKDLNEKLNESINNLYKYDGFDNIIFSLKPLEEWINIVCRELESCYSKIQENRNDIRDNDIIKKNDRLIREIKSYRSDNKKLYDINKKYAEDAIKHQILQLENNFLDSVILRLLKSHPNKDLAKIYNDLIDQYDLILNFENDKLRFEKAIDNLEKEYKYAISKKNNGQEANICSEIEKLRKIIFDLEDKIREKRDTIDAIDNDIKLLEERGMKEYLDSREVFTKNKDTNIFKANYVEKNKSNKDIYDTKNIRDEDFNSIDGNNEKNNFDSERKKINDHSFKNEEYLGNNKDTYDKYYNQYDKNQNYDQLSKEKNYESEDRNDLKLNQDIDNPNLGRYQDKINLKFVPKSLSHRKNFSENLGEVKTNHISYDQKIYENIESSLNNINEDIDNIMPTFKNSENNQEIKYIKPSSLLYKNTYNSIPFNK